MIGNLTKGETICQNIELNDMSPSEGLSHKLLYVLHPP